MKNCAIYEFHSANYYGHGSELKWECIFSHLVIKEQDKLRVFWKVTATSTIL